MKKTPRKRITSLLVAFTLMLTMVALPSMAMTVQAAAVVGKPNFSSPDGTGGGTTSTYQTIYFGENDYNPSEPSTPLSSPQPIKWRVLESTTEELFLLSENSVGNKTYHDSKNAYNGSYVNLHLTTTDPQPEFLAGFKEAELNGISKQIVWGGDNKGIDPSIPDPTGVYFYVLSTEEASNSTYFPNGDSDRKLSPDSSWWLRSACLDDLSAAIVGNDGNVTPNGGIVSGDDGVRPAFKINLTSVIFSSSAASGGKPTTVGANLSAATQPTAVQKLTVIDTNTSNLNLVIIPADSAPKTALQEETITIPYTDAITGGDKFVSCVVEDSDGDVAYYAKLTTAASGTANINIPANMTAGSYKIKMFNEQCNAANYTDFASNPIAIDLTILSAPTINGSATGTTDTISLFEGYTAHTQNYTIAGVLAPTVTITSDGGTGASITNAGLLTIPTGLAVGDYTIELAAINTQGSATMTVTVEVLEVPTAPTVTPASIALQEGNSGTFSVTMGTGTDKATSVSIISDTPAIATVDTATLTANGTVTVTGVAEGVANIYLAWTGGSLDDTTSTVAVSVSKLHTITLGASGNGTVSGGGTHAENTTITVTAKPNTGWHFVNWKENGNVISTDASYSFTVTGNRNLVAEFAEDTAPPVPPTPPIVTGETRSSSSGGTSKPDIAPVAGRAFTKPDATRLFNSALAAKPEGQTTLSIKARNYTSVDKAVSAELAALAQKNGVTLTVHFDTVKGGRVTSRISINPALVTTNLDLTVKIVGGKITLPKFSTPIEVAVKMPAGMTVETLKITQNVKDVTATAKPWLDKNGYLHFTTTGGEIVLSAK